MKPTPIYSQLYFLLVDLWWFLPEITAEKIPEDSLAMETDFSGKTQENMAIFLTNYVRGQGDRSSDTLVFRPEYPTFYVIKLHILIRQQWGLLCGVSHDLSSLRYLMRTECHVFPTVSMWRLFTRSLDAAVDSITRTTASINHSRSLATVLTYMLQISRPQLEVRVSGNFQGKEYYAFGYRMYPNLLRIKLSLWWFTFLD